MTSGKYELYIMQLYRKPRSKLSGFRFIVINKELDIDMFTIAILIATIKTA